MGRMIDGQWTTDWYSPDVKGRFVRPPTVFRGQVGDADSPVASGRYHLYVSYACPWAHRTLIVRRLRGLDAMIGVTVVDAFMGDDGWSFAQEPDSERDPILGARWMRQVYAHGDPHYTGRVTVPVLWDIERRTIVNNESLDIIRMFDTAFEPLATGPTLYPAALGEAIDREIAANYEPINNGVYKSGFARTQEAYEEAVGELFGGLDRCEATLSRSRYLCGDVLTEADVCLFTTLLRFDPVYHGHFKCNLRRIQDYPNLWGFVRDVYQTPGVRETCHMDHIKQHYYRSHPSVNPNRIVPVGPELDLDGPHGRG